MADYKDVPLSGAARGRGAGLNPGNRFIRGEQDAIRLHVLGEHLDEIHSETPGGRQVETTIVRDRSRSVINRVDSPDLPFNWTFNPYRGCEHGCAYCYARPTHEALGYSCGLDFETRIIAKHDAADLLLRELARPAWNGDPIAMAGVTDAYQPIERRLEITRRCLEVLAWCRQPVSIVTKNHLVTRDIDHLAELARHHAVSVALSITTLDADLARRLEPRASAPRDRLRAIEALTAHGVPTMVMVAPVIPGLNEHELPQILEAASSAGAANASWVMLRLPFQVKDIFLDWLQRNEPNRHDRVVHALERMHGGRLYDSTWRHRGHGSGALAEQVGRTFEVFCKRYGLNRTAPPVTGDHFRRPAPDGQMGLFE